MKISSSLCVPVPNPAEFSQTSLSTMECTSPYLAFVQEVGAKVVISSSWRILAMEELYSLLGPDGANVLYPEKSLTHTPHDRGMRGEQIREWFNLANIEPTDTNYIIIDDDSDFLEEQQSSFVHTYYKHGLNTMALEHLFFFAEEKGWI